MSGSNCFLTCIQISPWHFLTHIQGDVQERDTWPLTWVTGHKHYQPPPPSRHKPHRAVAQSLSHVWLSVTPWTAACQASLSFTISWHLLKLMSIETVMPYNYLILHRPLLLLQWTDFFSFFKKYKFINFNWRLITLQHCIGFAIHQHACATGIHVFPILKLLFISA